MPQQKRDGYIDARRLYTADGVNQATGLSTIALEKGRQAGALHPIYLANRLAQKISNTIPKMGKGSNNNASTTRTDNK